MSRYRSKYTSFQQLGLIKQSDAVPTRMLLLIVDAVYRLGSSYTREQMAEMFDIPVQGSVTRLQRLAEAEAVAAFWSSTGLTEAALEFDAPWHALTEPAQDKELTSDPEKREAFFAKLDDFLLANHRWPKIGTIRQWMGRPSNHREKGDVAGQDSLAV
jgi:hypothetical protein